MICNLLQFNKLFLYQNLNKRMTKRVTIASIVIFIISTILILTSCEDETTPELPEVSTIYIPDFNNSTQILKSTSNNAYIALSGIKEWTSFVSSDLEILKLAYSKALTTNAKNFSNKRWGWKYSVTSDFDEYYVEFNATLNNDKTYSFDMQILNADEIMFKNLSGIMQLEGSSGRWFVYKSYTENSPCLQIDWSKDPANQKMNVKYSVIDEDSKNYGAYILFGNNQNGDYDVFYDIFDKQNDNLIEIDFSSNTNIGRVRSFNAFQDSLWHCWDEEFINHPCN